MLFVLRPCLVNLFHSTLPLIDCLQQRNALEGSLNWLVEDQIHDLKKNLDYLVTLLFITKKKKSVYRWPPAF